MTRLRAWLLVALLLSAFAWANVAHAQGTVVTPSGAVSLTYGQRSVTFADLLARPAALSDPYSDFNRLLNRAWSNPAGNTVTVAERYGPRIGGAVVEVTATRAVTPLAVANAAVLLGGAAWAGFQAGGALNNLFGHTEFSIGPTRCVSHALGWKCDDGEDPSMVQLVECGNNGYRLGSTGVTAFAACSAYVSTIHPTPPNTIELVVAPGGSATDGPFNLRNCGPGWYGVWTCSDSGNLHGMPAAPGLACGPVIDALNPAWSNPAGGTPGPDGKCPTGRYADAPNNRVWDRVKDFGNLTGAIARDLAPHVLEKGGEIPATGPRDLSGPASAPNPNPTTTTTTNPDGSTSTSVRDGVVNYTYNNSTVNYTTSNTTTINNGGNTTTTTTTGEDPVDPCEKDPERIGCLKLGDPGDAKPTWTPKEIPFQAEDLGLGGSCPAPWATTWHGYSLAMSYQPLCDVAPIVRAGVLLLCGLGCIMFIIREVQS